MYHQTVSIYNIQRTVVVVLWYIIGLRCIDRDGVSSDNNYVQAVEDPHSDLI